MLDDFSENDSETDKWIQAALGIAFLLGAAVTLILWVIHATIDPGLIQTRVILGIKPYALMS